MHHKIIFTLQQDEDGYPPVSYEGVWAQHKDGHHYVLDNIPFFTREATLGDTVEATLIDDELHYSGRHEASGNSLIRVVYYEGTDPAELRERLEDLGCSTEWNRIHALIAVNIPPETSLPQVQAFLHQGFEHERWDYEEPILRQ